MIRLEKTEGVFGPTTQGEGVNIGMPVTFVRIYGCDFRCKWCDTSYSLGPDMGGEYETLEADEIVRRISRIPCKNIVISGGNPLIFQAKLEPLLSLLHNNGYFIQVETQGSLKSTFGILADVTFWSLSPKLPSAGEHEWKNWKAVQYFLDMMPKNKIQFKFVVGDLGDYEALKTRLTQFPDMERRPVILQPEGMQLHEGRFELSAYADSLRSLSDRVNGDLGYWSRFEDIRVLPQLHKISWGLSRQK